MRSSLVSNAKDQHKRMMSQRNPAMENSKFMKIRLYFVDKICQISDDFKLQSSTKSLSVHFFDCWISHLSNTKTMAMHVNDFDYMASSSFAAVRIAAKFQEMECRVPTLNLIEVYTLDTVGCDHIVHIENSIISMLNWRLNVITPMHLLDFYFTCGVVHAEDKVIFNSIKSSKSALDVESLPKYIKKWLDYFSEQSLRNLEIQSIDPTVIAASVILVSRTVLNIEPRWRSELTKLTGYKLDDLMICAQSLYEKYLEEADEPERNQIKMDTPVLSQGIIASF